ncbi:MAG: glycosyltransferase family 4 protein [Nitrososphaerota archaeon]
MKKLHIASFHPSIPREAGAAGAFIDMMVELKKTFDCSIDVYTLCLNGKIEEKYSGMLNFKAYPFRENYPLGYLNPINILRCVPNIKKISKEINNSHYDVAFLSHYAYSPILMGYLKIPKIYYCYEPPRIFYEKIKQKDRIIKNICLPTKILDKKFVRMADIVLCNSKYISNYIKKVYNLDAKVCYLGVNLEKHKKIKTSEENSIIVVGVIHPAKAQDFVVKSLSLIPKNKRPKLNLITSGVILDKKYYMYLINLSQKLEVKISFFTEYLPDYEFSLNYSKSSFSAVPFIREPSLEPVAYAYEKPIIGVNEGGVPEVVVPNETGILTPRDTRKFSEAIEFLIDNPEICKNMGIKGRKWLENNFTYKKCVYNLMRFIEEVINCKS